MSFSEQLTEYISTLEVSEFGFADISTAKAATLFNEQPGTENYNTAISIVIKLSSSVLKGITDKPTHYYFHHYRTVNTHIDSILLKIGMYLEKNGYGYFPVGASQSINGYQGVFPHKTAARLAGLGYIGKNAMFISDRFGMGVRLGTLLTDAPLETSSELSKGSCGSCSLCVNACPAMALSGENFSADTPEVNLIDRHTCSEYMKDNFQRIGRGSVCGVCMRNCPKLYL